MILSRLKPAVVASKPRHNHFTKECHVPSLEDFLKNRDYVGAITLLEFNRHTSAEVKDTNLWLGYCSFHLSDYKTAIERYQKELEKEGCSEDVWLYLACCYFMLGMYKEADEAVSKQIALKTDDADNDLCMLANRLLFHIALNTGDAKRILKHQGFLSHSPAIEDRCSLASYNYLKSDYNIAASIYRSVFTGERDKLAIPVYIAQCYYKQELYDVSQEVLSTYLPKYPDSIGALNLKACIEFRLFDGSTAEAKLRKLEEKISNSTSYGRDIIQHNLVVFRRGAGALRIFPGLLNTIPEATLNLVIYYLKQNEPSKAYEFMKSFHPKTTEDYIVKAITFVLVGQENDSVKEFDRIMLPEHLRAAQSNFNLVGSSEKNRDTIMGRQCMASSYFILKKFEDVITYLDSIKEYMYNDDSFNMNFAQAKAQLKQYKEAEEIFHLVHDERIRSDYLYQGWLAKCYIMNGKPRHAWELYLKSNTSADCYSLIKLIASDCYRTGQFYYSAKAFDVLERLDPSEENWEGLRGACIGVFQRIIKGHGPRDMLMDAMQMLLNSSNPETDPILDVMKKWCKENNMIL